MDKEKEIKQMQRELIMFGICVMGFHFATKNPETGKILFYENAPEINDTGVKWSEEGKDFYGKADHIFKETDFDKYNICMLDMMVMLDNFYK